MMNLTPRAFALDLVHHKAEPSLAVDPRMALRSCILQQSFDDMLYNTLSQTNRA